MGKDPNQLRVQRDPDPIRKLLLEQGFSGVLSCSGTRIDIWGDKQFMGTMSWIPNSGWRLSMVVPFIKTNQDLELALDRLVETKTAIQAANVAWENHRNEKTEESWQTYLGVLAAYDLKQFKPPERV